MFVAQWETGVGVDFLDDLYQACEKAIHLHHFPRVRAQGDMVVWVCKTYIDGQAILPIRHS